MNLHINFKHIQPDELIKEFIQVKSESLTRYFEGKININWTLSAEKQNRIAHGHLLGNSMDYFGEGTSHDLKVSIGIAMEKIEKQVRKHKEIITSHT
jgi:putative sigma-54 modulation protein